MLLELFHDQGTGYISNIEPTKTDSVTVRLRATKGAVAEANIQCSEEGSRWMDVSMKKCEADDTGYYEFWEGTMPASEERYYYRFYALGESGCTYFGAEGMSKRAPVCRDCFVIIPGMKTPDWAKGFLWYSIMPDPFYNGDVLNDITESGLKKTIPWGAPLRGLYEYYGGDIKGILAKMDYIKEIGPDGIYVNPTWTSESNAGYGPNNYYETSPNYGNEEDLITLSKTIHDNGMKFMIDAVFSYSQANSIFTNQNGHQPLLGAFESQESAYSEMFVFEKWPYTYVHKWGGIENDLGSDMARDLLWRREDSVLQRYLREPYDVDGWRFDAIASYAGTDTNLGKIAAEIHDCTKAVKQDALLIGEDFMVNQIMSGNWDSCQNSFFLFSAKLWFQRGQFNQSWLLDRLNMMTKLPRAVGLCLYNNFDLHDVRRLITDYETEKHLVKAVWLLQMTYVGSPVIYYGDEIGAVNDGVQNITRSRNSFNWNTKDWKEDLLALCKTLSALRKEYTALKNGAFKVGVTDDERQLTVFGRWDKNGSVVTMLNQCNYVQTVSLDLKQYNISDGTVMTDYLTGQTYVVENGCATVDIPAGGSILVTGLAGRYRNEFRLREDVCRDSVVIQDEHTYVMKACDKKIECITPIYGCGLIEVAVGNELDGGAIFLQDGTEGNRVMVQFVKNHLRMLDGTGKLICETDMLEQGTIRLEIRSDGCAALFLQDTLVKDSLYPMTRTEKYYVGIATNGNAVKFSGVHVSKGEAALYDDFSQNHLSNLFAVSHMRGNYEVANGKLRVQAKETSLLLTEERSLDFTFKAKLCGSAGGVAGITSCCDEENGVALVRDVTENDSLIFGYLKNGALIPCETIVGDFSDGVELQLQRIGSVYTAVYTVDGRIKCFKNQIMANLSVSRGGILCEKGAEAEFAYACFGNSIQDGHSVNIPVAMCKESDWHKASKQAIHDRMLEKYSIIGDEEEWEYALGGIRRKVECGLSQLAVTNKTYGNFKIQCTLLRQSGAGTMGITMLRSCMDKTLGDGYILSLAADGTLAVIYQDEVLFKKKLEEISPYGLKLNIIFENGRMSVYIGADNELLTCIPSIPIENGYLGFYLDNVSGHINNYMICDYFSPWVEPVSPWALNVQSDNNGLIVQNAGLVMAGLRGGAYTDVQISGRIILNREEKEKETYAGFLFSASHDVEPKLGGVLVALNQEGQLYISKKGELKQSVCLGTQIPSVYLSVIVEKGNYQVYTYDNTIPILTWQDEERNGGVMSIVSENSKTGFYDLEVHDLTLESPIWTDEEYLISRNGQRIARTDTYTEEATGDVVYHIEPRKPDDKKYTLEMDITVYHPESEDTYPIVYIRTGTREKIGLYCKGDLTRITGKKRGDISDENAERVSVFGKRKEGETYHVRIESEPDKITAKVNDSYFFEDIRLSTCLSGDYSNLPFVPEIVCVQGKEGKTKTVISNIRFI